MVTFAACGSSVPLSGDDLREVIKRKATISGSLNGWLGDSPDGLLDAYIVMIPKADDDTTFLGEGPLIVFPVVNRIWASARA